MSTLFSDDGYRWPGWAPNWLRRKVEAPDCANGTHPRLRDVAKWLTIYFAEDTEGAERWLKHAAALCDRDVPQGEIERLLAWAKSLFGRGRGTGEKHVLSGYSAKPQPDLEEIYALALAGPTLEQYRESSPQRLS
jgi:hypothetical protein